MGMLASGGHHLVAESRVTPMRKSEVETNDLDSLGVRAKERMPQAGLAWGLLPHEAALCSREDLGRVRGRE